MKYKLAKLLLVILPVSLSYDFSMAQKAMAENIFIKNVDVSSKKNHIPLEVLLTNIERSYNLSFVYEDILVQDIMVPREKLDAEDLGEELNQVMNDVGLTYTRESEGTYIITSRPPNAITENQFQETVSGMVTDEQSGEPLPGVNIVIKDTQIGTTTDSEGQFSLRVSDLQEVLVISYIGYQSQEVPISNQREVNIAMRSEILSSDELVVTAFGLKREVKSLTYSTEGVNSQQIRESSELNVINSLQGRVAGLVINQSGGGVGAESRVILRGNRSINGDSQPIYVVDGVQIRGVPTDLNSKNIASINVLKGANAAALYGSDAQNGVIIIETERGEAESLDISLNNSFLVQKPRSYINHQNEYGQGFGGSYSESAESAWGPRMEGQMVDHWSLDPSDAGTQYAFTPQPNTKDEIYQNGFNLASNLNISMGSENITGSFSYTKTNALGIVPKNELDRHNISARITSSLTEKLSLDTKVDFVHQVIDNPVAQDYSNFNPSHQIYTMPPNIRLDHLKNYEFIDSDGLLNQNWWNPSSTSGANPFWTINRNLEEVTRNRVISMASLTYDFTDYLSLMVRGSYDGENNKSDQKLYNDTYTRAEFGRYEVSTSDDYMVQGDFLLSYEESLNEDWNLNVNLGGNFKQRENSSLLSSTGDALLVPNFFTISNTELPITSFSPGDRIKEQSLYSFAQVGWRDVIYLDISGRNDWSSTLPADNWSYFYPSAGVSAILSDLIPEISSVFSFAKVRASWAKVGSSAPPYMLERTASFSAGGKNGFLELSSIIPNEDLKPEETESLELGVDLRFFEGRLGFDATWYNANTRNQLFTVALPSGSGASSYFTNGGNIHNTGLEFLVKTVPIQAGNISWDLNFHFSTNRNEVKEISDDRPRVVIGSDPYMREFVVEEGEPFGQLYSRGFLRDEQGRVIIGNNGLPRITSGRTVKIANFSADWQGGISSTFNVGNFGVNVLIDHKQGGSIASMTDALLASYGASERTLQGRDGGLIFGDNFFSDETAVKDDGTPNDIAVDAETFWTTMGGRNAPVGEAFVEDATNTRLKEVVLSYSLPQGLLNRTNVFSDVRISLIGRDLLYLYRAAENLDPEFIVGTNPMSEGYQSFSPPTSQSFGVIINMDF